MSKLFDYRANVLCAFIFVILPGFTTHLFSQDWISYTLDDVVMVDAPPNARVSDTADFTMYQVQAFPGLFVFGNSTSTGSVVTNNKALKKYYSEFVKGYEKGTKGKVVDSRACYYGNIEGQSIRVSTKMNGQDAILDCRVFLFNDKIYQFQLMQPVMGHRQTESLMNRYFSSIKFIGNPSSAKQYVKAPADSSMSHSLGYKTGKLLVWLIVIGLIVYAITKLRSLR